MKLEQYTLFDLLQRYNGDRNEVRLYECRFSIIADGAPYSWPEADLVAAAPMLGGYLNRPVERWEVVDGCLHVVVGFAMYM